jgi:hypothetical protein
MPRRQHRELSRAPGIKRIGGDEPARCSESVANAASM